MQKIWVPQMIGEMKRGELAMLRSLKDLERYKVGATDGDIGNVVDFFLDDKYWVIRYLVVETGRFLNQRHVLISPISFRQVDSPTKRFHLALTRDKIKNSPSIDVDKPVSRQHESEYYGYYGYPYYWGSSWFWGASAYPGFQAEYEWNQPQAEVPDPSSDCHLRSANEVRGYHIQGNDEAIGHVEDFIVDDETWAIRYLVVDTSNWWLGKRVLIAPHWATTVSWEQKNVCVGLNRERIKNSPEWSARTAISRDYETRLHEHYGRPAYWIDEERRARVAQPESRPVWTGN